MFAPTRPLPTLLFLTLLAALAGCGESHTADDSGVSVPDGGSDDGGTLPDADNPDTGGGVVTDGGFVDAGSPDTGGGIVTDGGFVDASGPDSGGGVVDGGGPTDSGAGVIACGDMLCDATSEQCCVSGGGGGATSMCIPTGDMCMGASVDCDGPEDCSGGDVCCGGFSGTGITVTCAPAAMCGGFTGFELCHDVADCTDATDMCCPIMRGGVSTAFCSPRCFGGTP